MWRRPRRARTRPREPEHWNNASHLRLGEFRFLVTVVVLDNESAKDDTHRRGEKHRWQPVFLWGGTMTRLVRRLMVGSLVLALTTILIPTTELASATSGTKVMHLLAFGKVPPQIVSGPLDHTGCNSSVCISVHSWNSKGPFVEYAIVYNNAGDCLGVSQAIFLLYGPGTRNQPYWHGDTNPNNGVCWNGAIFPLNYEDSNERIGVLNVGWWLCGTVPNWPGEPCAQIGSGATPPQPWPPFMPWNTWN